MIFYILPCVFNQYVMKILLALSFLWMSFFSFSQKDSIPFVDGKIQFEKIISIENKTAGELYSQAKLIMSNLYQSGKAAMDSYDDDALYIATKGISYYPLKDWLGSIEQKLEHTLILQFKDGRVRITFTNLIVSTIPAENILGNAKRNPYGKKIKQSHAQGILNTWNEIESILKSEFNKKTDDW